MIKDIAEQLDMTPNGFKVSIETEKFPIGKVRDLCDILQISIAEFFGETTTGDAAQVGAEAIPYNMGGNLRARCSSSMPASPS